MISPWLLMDPDDPRRDTICRDCQHTWADHTWKGYCQGAENACTCRTSKGQPKRFSQPKAADQS